MSADPLTILRTLDDAPVGARPELHDALLGRLLVELQAPPTWRDRLQVPRVRVRVRRLAIATATVALTAAAVLAAFELRGWLAVPEAPVIDQPPEVEPSVPPDPAPPTGALETVLDARARWLAAPRALHATSVTERVEEDGTSSTTRTEVWFRGYDAWRVTSSTGSSDGLTHASTTIWDGRRELALGDWLEGRPSAQLTSYQATGRHPFGTPLRDWAASSYAWERRCSDAAVLADTEVAGRRAHHVRCGDEQLWLDAETGLLLRHERPAGADDHDLARQIFTVTNVTYDPDLPAASFLTDPPTDRPLSEFTELPSVLQPGDLAPPFDARTAEGRSVDVAELRGRYLLVVFWSPGLFDLGTVEQLHRSGHDQLSVVVYDHDATHRQETAAYVAARGYTVPVVFDAAPPTDGALGSIAQTWWSAGEPPPGQVQLAQLFVVVGPDGHVVDTWAGNLLPEDLDAWLTDAGVDLDDREG